MVGAAAHGHGGVHRYYICTRQNHEGGKHSCQASRLPSDALEHGAAVILPPPPPPETPTGAAADAGNDPDLLTEDGQVRMTVQKAPRERFELSTRRLTAGCSTIEL